MFLRVLVNDTGYSEMSDCTTFSEFISEPVDDEYGWGYYSGFRLLIRKKDGFVNATRLCDDSGRTFAFWLQLNSSARLIHQIETEGALLGTVDADIYVPPACVPHIASWLSPSFALKASEIVNNSLAKECIESQRQQLIETTIEVVDKINSPL